MFRFSQIVFSIRLYGCQVWFQSGSDWPQMGQIWGFFRSDFSAFGANLTHFGAKPTIPDFFPFSHLSSFPLLFNPFFIIIILLKKSCQAIKKKTGSFAPYLIYVICSPTPLNSLDPFLSPLPPPPLQPTPELTFLMKPVTIPL